MKISEFDDKAITGQFDTIFLEKCPTYHLITWRVMKSLAFSESELHPYVENGLFRTPNRLFREYEGKDPYDPSDAVSTAYRILCGMWDNLFMLTNERERLLYTLASYKFRILKPSDLVGISSNFNGLYVHFPLPSLHSVVKIKDYAEIF